MNGSTSALAQLGSVEGSLTLIGENTSITPTGGTLTNSGTMLSVQETSTLTVTGNLTNSGTLDTGNGVSDTGNNVVSISGLLTNNGTINLDGVGDSLSADLTNAGPINLNANGDILTDAGVFNNNSGGSLTLSANANTVTVTGAFNNGGGASIAMSGTNGTIGITGKLTTAGTLTIAGAGNTLTADLDNSGPITLSGNNDTVTDTGDLNNLSGGSVTLSATTDSGGVAGMFNNNAGATLAFVAPSSNGNVSVTGATTNNGTVNMTGSNDTLAANGGFTNAGAGSVAIGQTETLSTGSNNYTQTGGTTVVRGTLDAAVTAIQGGTLSVDGVVVGAIQNTGGFVNPFAAGSPATLADTGNYTQGPGGTLMIDLGGTAPGEFSVLDVSGIRGPRRHGGLYDRERVHARSRRQLHVHGLRVVDRRFLEDGPDELGVSHDLHGMCLRPPV